MSSSTLTNQSPTAMASESAFYPKEKTQLYVEGEADYNFFKRVCDRKECHIRDCNGVEKVISTIKEGNQNKQKGQLGVADKDYNELLHRLQNINNLCYTDTHDMETLILSKNVFNNILYEYGDEQVIDTIEKLHGQTIEEIILGYCTDIGYARLYCQQKDLCLSFSNMNISNFISDRFEFDTNRYLECLIRTSYLSSRKKAEVLSDIDEFLDDAPDYDTWKICQGHDITSFIAVFFDRFCKNSKAKALDKSFKVESHLRTLFVNDYFKNTQLYHSMVEWNNKNPSYKLFTI